MPIVGDVCALDLAREYGSCRGAVGVPLAEAKCTHGIFGGKRDVPTEHLFAAAAEAIRGLITGCGLVVYESAAIPQHMHGKTNIQAIRIAFGLAAVCEAVCFRQGIEVREARVSDVRDHFIQSHRLKSKDAKAAVWQRAKAMGLECATMDESDAAALWHYMCALIDPRVAARATPLFAKVS